MKLQIGSGSSHTTLKYLDRLKFSIKVSTIKERIVSPSNEYNPVLISKIKKPAIVIKRSENIRAGPILKLEYFFKIIAIISVPPLELPMLNKIADPKAGSAIAKHSSRIGWSVNGSFIGQMRSRKESVNESKILQYAVFAANFLPRTIIPMIRSVILTIKLKSAAVIRPVLATRTARPVIPPKVKLFVNLKK